MTEDELREEAKRQGFNLAKIPCYQCSCYVPYPNINHKNKNGSWKCVDRYEPIEHMKKSMYGAMTHCRKKGGE